MDSVEIIQELSHNFIYSAYDTNTNRAFPDARDGLKPGMRCILWEMYKRGYSSSKPHVKSAKVSGGVIANWWPHGSTAIYETFVRMSQPFTNNNPEVDFHGANGNVILGGDSFAADRYTEVRLSKIAEEGILDGIEKNAVDMVLNFSEDEYMPSIMPSVFPRLLVNGSQGIGVSIANTWVTHNLQETADVIKEYVKTGEVDNDSYYPDFPVGGTIINKNELPQINKTGKGRVIVEAKYEIKGREIRFTEFPFQVYIEPLVEEIKEAIESDKVHNVREVFNKSDKTQLLLTVTCSNSAKIQDTLEELFQYTSLRTQYNVNQMAIVSKTPTLLTLKDMCQIYVEHNQECIRREYEFDLKKTLERIEILEGYMIAFNHIDDFISIIRTSDAPRDELVVKYSLTAAQVDAILSMRLSRLSKLESSKIAAELEEKRELAAKLEKVVSSGSEQRKVLLKRLASLAKKYGSPRRTEVVQRAVAVRETKKKVAPPQDVVLCLDKNGYMKSVPIAKYRSVAANVREVKSRTDEIVTLYSSLGRAYRIKTSAVKQCLNSDKGTALGSILSLAPTERIVDFTGRCESDILLVTANGLVKKIKSSVLSGTTQNLRGMPIIKLKDGDEVFFVGCLDDFRAVVVESSMRTLTFDVSKLLETGKAASGRCGIKLDAADKVCGVTLLEDIPKTTQALGTKGVKKR